MSRTLLVSRWCRGRRNAPAGKRRRSSDSGVYGPLDRPTKVVGEGGLGCPEVSVPSQRPFWHVMSGPLVGTVRGRTVLSSCWSTIPTDGDAATGSCRPIAYWRGYARRRQSSRRCAGVSGGLTTSATTSSR